VGGFVLVVGFFAGEVVEVGFREGGLEPVGVAFHGDIKRVYQSSD
jgi:hypothetical protein